jgi:hypothetical protein
MGGCKTCYEILEKSGRGSRNGEDGFYVGGSGTGCLMGYVCILSGEASVCKPGGIESQQPSDRELVAREAVVEYINWNDGVEQRH